MAIADLTAALVPSSIAIRACNGGSRAAGCSVSVTRVPLPASRMTNGVAATSVRARGRRRRAHRWPGAATNSKKRRRPSAASKVWS